MMKINYKIIFIYLVVFSTLISCNKEDELNYEKREISESTNAIDVFLKEHFLDKYNSAVRWEWDDKYVDIEYYVGPPEPAKVIPTAEFIEDFWINPYAECSEKAKQFISDNFPTEVILIGTQMLNENGTSTLGFAEAGVRITLTEINDFDLKNLKWLRQQLHTMHHEFSHIVHQTYKLPAGYELVSGSMYTGNSWTSLMIYPDQKTKEQRENETEEEWKERMKSIVKEDNTNGIKLGCVTPYGTSNAYEDFAELVSFFLITKEADFTEEYMPKSEEEIREVVRDTVNSFYAKVEKVQTEAYNSSYAQAYKSNYEHYYAKYIGEGKTEEESKTLAEEISKKLATSTANKVADAARLKMPEISEVIEPIFEKAYNKAKASGMTDEEAQNAAFAITAPYVSDMTFIATERALIASEKLKSLNAGKKLIKQKLDMVLDYYKSNFDIDLAKLRDIIQERIVNAQK